MVAHLVRTSALATVSRTTALSVSSIQAEKEGLNSNEYNKNCLTKIQATMQTEQTLKGLADRLPESIIRTKSFLPTLPALYLERANVEDYVMDGQRVSNRTI